MALTRRRNPRLTYLLLQIPDVLVIGTLLWAAAGVGWMSAPLAWGLFAGWLLKDVLVYRYVAPTLFQAPVLGREKIIGQVGYVVVRLDPTGTLELEGERWRARLLGGEADVGSAVVVVGFEGLTLLVRATESELCVADSAVGEA